MLKKTLTKIVLSIFFLILSDAQTFPRHNFCEFFPNNTLSIPINTNELESSLIQERDYQGLLKIIESTYSSVFKSRGLVLIIQSDWQDSRVNSYATRDSHNNPVLVAPGGLARHPLISSDGILAILCHEIGHFLGGAPKAPRGQSTQLSWSSAEGEADYFSSSKCLKIIFNDTQENQNFVNSLPLTEQTILKKNCSNSQCMRILEAGKNAATVFASVQGIAAVPDFNVIDTSRVSKTIYTHPLPQCRLDTFRAGAKCEISPQIDIDDQDPNIGACTLLQNSNGARPSCWYLH